MNAEQTRSIGAWLPSLGANAWGRLGTTAGAFAVYPELLRLTQIPLSDDGFISDIFNGELPMRIHVGEALLRGELPTWSRLAGNGFPVGVGTLGDPLAALVFALVPRTAALSVFLTTLLLLAAHGTYGLVRRLGGSAWGGVFAAIAFSNSGYFIAQLRHTSIMATVVWLPWGLLALDRALFCRDGELPSWHRSLRPLAWFAGIIGLQALAGFPQSLYICCTAYGIYAAGALLEAGACSRQVVPSLILAALTSAALTVGLAIGGLSWLPIIQLAENSGRDQSFAAEAIKKICYRPIDALNLVIPYSQGDASNISFQGPCPFWEVYGYAGLSTAIFAVAGLLTARKRLPNYLLAIASVLAMVAVLGPATRLFPWVWENLPGLNRFRYPTRFLVIVDFGLAVLAGSFLSDLVQWLRARGPRAGRCATPLAILALAWLVVDLFHHQRRQNHFVDARSFLEPPAVVRYLSARIPEANVLTPLPYAFHRRAFRAAFAWTDPEPYRKLRGTLPPNLGLLWNIPSVDLYAGIAPGYWATLWGDHVHFSLLGRQASLSDGQITLSPTYLALARTFGVTHLTSSVPVIGESIPRPTILSDGVHVYELEGKRARWLQASIVNPHPTATATLMQRVDLEKVLLLADGEALMPNQLLPEFEPTVRDISPRHVRVDVSGARGGYLFLADTYYPGWIARVDGVEVPIHRANIAGRAVRLPVGAQVVDFEFRAPVMVAGALLSAVGLTALALWGWVASRLGRQKAAPAES